MTKYTIYGHIIIALMLTLTNIHYYYHPNFITKFL